MLGTTPREFQLYRLSDYSLKKVDQLNFTTMKQLFFIAVVSFALFSCSGNKKQAGTSSDVQTSVSVNGKVFELDDLMAVAGQEVNNTITVIGYVTHICKHSGKRCFIVGESQKVSMRVEAKGEIGRFNRKVTGSKLAITGVLKEQRLSQEYIDEMEKGVDLKKEEAGENESCAAKLSSISNMRKWMKEHNKDYYAIYYLDGLNFEIAD